MRNGGEYKSRPPAFLTARGKTHNGVSGGADTLVCHASNHTNHKVRSTAPL